MRKSAQQTDTATRFTRPTETALRAAGWQPGRWDAARAEAWADELRAHMSSGGHVHLVFPAAIEAWAEFGGLRIAGQGPGRHIAPTPFTVDPLYGLHLARTLSDLGQALDTRLCPLGEEQGHAQGAGSALLAIDEEGRVYSLDHTGDWYLGADLDQALETLVTGTMPARLAT
ncbi:SUKH-3 domain-containing protein [Streptomyces sp. NPDC051940]|uniref:SUKH-3 domain-containing protein n=1 Tax=Streptomyces sp. NPDC051940 TaxID=3155675 RepID=UPI0034125609